MTPNPLFVLAALSQAVVVPGRLPSLIAAAVGHMNAALPAATRSTTTVASGAHPGGAG